MPRLKETCPLVQRIRQLETLALELGLTLSCRCYDGQLLIRDERSGHELEYRDLDQGGSGDDGTTNEFPWHFDTKIILTEDERERVKRNKEVAEVT